MEKRIREILKEVREIEIQSKRVVDAIFGGEYRSSFKGKGMEFHEVRDYIIGDDIRTIDWNVTARMNHPYVKRFIEERELTLFILADISGSGEFGSRKEAKKDLIARISALFAFSAVKNNDKVGLLLFTDEIEHYLPSNKGISHTLRLVRDILMYSPKSKGTDPLPTIEFTQRILRHGTIVFLISDFIGENFAIDHIRMPLSMMAKKFDLIPIIVRDPLEENLSFSGRVVFRDAEKGVVRMFGGKELKERFTEIRKARDQELFKFFKTCGLDRVQITSTEDYVGAIHRFFHQRMP